MRQLAIHSIFLFGLALAGVSPALAQPDIPHPDLPPDNLAYPALIILLTGVGSGFFLTTGTSTYLVTAKHVLFDQQTGALAAQGRIISYSKDPTDLTPNVTTVDFLAARVQENLKSHPTADVVVVKCFNNATESQADQTTVVTALPGVVVLQKSKTGMVVAPTNLLIRFDDVYTGNEVILYGYPVSLGLKELPELDVNHPLLRKGIVAGKNQLTHSLILDCPSYFGDSGGPVVEVERVGFATTFRIIGVMSKYVPFVGERSVDLILFCGGLCGTLV